MPDTSLTPPAVPTRSVRRLGAAALIAGSLAIAAGACSPTSTESTTSSTTTSSVATTSGTSAPAGTSTYADIAALHQAIVDGGFACTLEYPGLKDDASSNEVSICTIDDEQAFLTIWGDPANLAAFASSSDGSTGTVALGANWSVSVTSAALAGQLATALGGTAPSAG